MTTNYIPPVGTRGLYRLLAPFDTLLLPNVAYRCAAVRSLSEIVAAGGNPEADYYTPAGLTTEKYLADAGEGVCIVSLQTSANNTVHVPSSHIASYPNLGGVPYSALVLAISLGAVPDSLDLTYIKSKIADTVRENLGIDSTVKTVVVSHPTLLTDVEHTTIEAARRARVGTVVTDYSRYIEAAAQRDSAYQKISELEAYINSLPRP